jgi:hypothetical protein
MNRPSWTSFSNFASTIVRPISVALALAALGTIGCIPFGDPEPPGASGNIALGEGVTTEGFATLHFRAAPAAPFDPAAPSFPASGGEGSDWSSSIRDLTDIAFPQEYSVDAGGPTTPSESWQLFAWLSASSDMERPSQPASGEPFGRATFALDDCGNFGDYCAVTQGVDITINQIAP